MITKKVQVTLPADHWDELLDVLAAAEAREAWLLGSPEGVTIDTLTRLSSLIDEIGHQLEAKPKRRAS